MIQPQMLRGHHDRFGASAHAKPEQDTRKTETPSNQRFGEAEGAGLVGEVHSFNFDIEAWARKRDVSHDADASRASASDGPQI